LYAYYQSHESNLTAAERRLLDDVDNLYELFIYMLSFWVEVRRFADQRIEENKKKIFPTEEDLNPNMKFVNNRILKALDENDHLIRLEQNYKINWANDRDDFIRAFYGRMVEYPEFQEYMNNGKDSFDDDRKFLITVIDNYMAEDDSIYDYFADRKLAFNSDYQLGVYLLWKFFTEMRPDFSANSVLPSAYTTEKSETNNDKEFVVQLFRKTILHAEEYRQLVQEHLSNWDYDRLALMDKILIFMALTEFCQFHSIPVKVTINEYIEISKFYSTADSRRFVNGMLDKLSNVLKENGKLVKTGMGLVDK